MDTPDNSTSPAAPPKRRTLHEMNFPEPSIRSAARTIFRALLENNQVEFDQNLCWLKCTWYDFESEQVMRVFSEELNACVTPGEPSPVYAKLREMAMQMEDPIKFWWELDTRRLMKIPGGTNVPQQFTAELRDELLILGQLEPGYDITD